MVREFIDKETGEVYNILRFTTVEEQARIDKYNKERQRNNGSEQYVQIEQNEAMEFMLNNEIDFTLLGACLVLASYITWGSNNLPFNKVGDIYKALNVTDKPGAAILNKLESSGLIKRDGKNIEVNKEIFDKGSIDSNSFVKAYSLRIRGLVEHLSLSQIGMLFVIIPYLGINSNALVWNPHEAVKENLIPLTMEDLSQIFGFKGEKSIFKRLSNAKIVLDGHIMYAITPLKRDGMTMIFVNPALISRKLTATEYMMFSVYKKETVKEARNQYLDENGRMQLQNCSKGK